MGVLKKYIPQIIISVVVLYIVVPSIDSAMEMFLGFAGYVSESYINNIYREAAVLDQLDFAFLMYAIMSLPILVFPIALMLRVLLGERASEEDSGGFSETIAALNKKYPIAKVASKFVVLCFCLFFASTYLAVFFSNYKQLTIVTSFRQHMRIIAPDISDNEEEVLVGLWSSMRSENDYLVLQSKLDKIAEANGRVLPENEIYRPDTFF